MAKLAFLVVYVFDKSKQKLFDIHRDRFRRHTKVDYQIFAATHKLDADVLQYVQNCPEIEIVDCEVPANLGVRPEHSHCLSRLAEHALQGDSTHLMTVHLDSFPVLDHWHDDLLKAMGDRPGVASLVPNGYSGGLLWPRSFSDQHRPRMLVSDEERASKPFADFCSAHPDYDQVETGLGYLYCAWRLGLPIWKLESNADRKIYDGRFFHMVSATHLTWHGSRPLRKGAISQSIWKTIFKERAINRFVPKNLKVFLQSLFVDKTAQYRDGSVKSKLQEIADLQADPEGYIDQLIQAYLGSRRSQETFQSD